VKWTRAKKKNLYVIRYLESCGPDFRAELMMIYNYMDHLWTSGYIKCDKPFDPILRMACINFRF